MKIFFDANWKHLDIRRPHHGNSVEHIKCPHSFELMKQLARKLNANIPFVRIGFYEINGKVYFGKITFSQLLDSRGCSRRMGL